jgi:hypothetical protein
MSRSVGLCARRIRRRWDGFFRRASGHQPRNRERRAVGSGQPQTQYLHGPSWSNFGFSVIKDTKITESKTLQFRVEFCNSFDQATFSNPVNLLGATGLGEITRTATTEREIQFGLRFVF